MGGECLTSLQAKLFEMHSNNYKKKKTHQLSKVEPKTAVDFVFVHVPVF